MDRALRERLGKLADQHLDLATRALGNLRLPVPITAAMKAERFDIQVQLDELIMKLSRQVFTVERMGRSLVEAALPMFLAGLAGIGMAAAATRHLLLQWARPFAELAGLASRVTEEDVTVHFPHLRRKDEIGTLARIVVLLQDLISRNSDLKKAAKLANRAEGLATQREAIAVTRLAKLSENLPHGVLLVDPKVGISVNNVYMQIYGLPAAMAGGGSFEILLDHHARLGLLSAPALAYEAVAADRMSAGRALVHQARLTDGRTIKIRERPLPGGGWLSVHEDFTEQGRLHRQLERAERFLVQVSDNIGEAILARDPQTRQYIFANRAAEKLLGVRRDLILGKTAREVLGDSAASRIENDDELLIGKVTAETEDEYFIETPENGSRKVAVRRLRMSAGRGDADCLLSVIRDLAPAALSAAEKAAPFAVGTLEAARQ
ncbi:hypothetical protein AXW83_13565 [Bosea sp. PAMC 26642]|nr:hypothetical protein AXW83_13565 [Bosea sp. PAMC 26642]